MNQHWSTVASTGFTSFDEGIAWVVTTVDVEFGGADSIKVSLNRLTELEWEQGTEHWEAGISGRFVDEER